MSDKRIAEYLVKAEECRLEAGRASHEDESAAWLRMAEEWLRLSRGVAAVEQQDIHRKTRVDGETHPVHSRSSAADSAPACVRWRTFTIAAQS